MSRLQLNAAILILLVVAAGCSGDDAASTTTSREPSIGTTATRSPRSTTVPTSTTAATTTTRSTPPETTAAPWDTWTLIYASLNTDDHDRADAHVIALGIEEGGVLLSDDYPSLNPGYWVVFAGEWGSREIAGNRCPVDLDPSLSCYPRYLGDALATVAADWAVVEYNYSLDLVNTTTGETERTIREAISMDGGFAGTLALDRAHSNLYYALGFEDYWYSCDSSMGRVERLDLETGRSETFSDGWATTISPNGRWLAVIAPSECFPDPENANWVLAPGDTIRIFDSWGVGVAVNPAGEVLISVSDRIILPSGEEIRMDGPVHNVAW